MKSLHHLQSKWRCFAWRTVSHVVLEESGQIQLNKDNLRLSDPNCILHSNGTHLLANVPLDGCGTQIEDGGTYLIFKNRILSNDDPSTIIRRETDVDIEFCCNYSMQGDVLLSYIAHRPSLTFTKEGFGTFTYQFEFFQSQAFTQQDAKSYPLEFDVGDMMYMQIESISSVPNTELFAESCRATPSDNPHDATSYPIILNGCKADETVQIYANSNRSKVQFAMKAFKFMGHHDQVYITCSVILCEAGMTNSRCSQGCSRSSQVSKREASFQTATNPSSGHQIHKRDVHMQGSGHFVSQGPLRLRHHIDSPGAKEMNMNLIFCVSCLLAVITMICGVVVHRTPRSPNTGMV
ncbi:ZP domain-containing protein-like [Clupea harengus]|uniref:ZP domain-containing protein-like n=1 Tax=Clupea harengus TaxID=7950 RepID=A0A6P8EWA8_CLUHA|nr:ZP domain-containing protein-like [Clupea harengus]